MADSAVSRNVINIRQKSPVLLSGRELVGILEGMEPVGGGLLRVRIAGLERLVAEELEEELRALVGKKVSLVRVGDEWSVIENV